MKLAEAKRLDEEGKLSRRVLTEQGWYIPSTLGVKTLYADPVQQPPAVFRRRPGRPKKAVEI